MYIINDMVTFLEKIFVNDPVFVSNMLRSYFLQTVA